MKWLALLVLPQRNSVDVLRAALVALHSRCTTRAPAASGWSSISSAGLSAWRWSPILTAMSDHIEFAKRRARKSWPCQASDHACRGPIEPGDHYVQVDHGQGRARTTRRYAWACAALAFGGDFMQVLEARGVVPPREPTATGDERRFRRIG